MIILVTLCLNRVIIFLNVGSWFADNQPAAMNVGFRGEADM